MSQNVFDNDLVAIRKNKVTTMLNKPAYIGICILELIKVLRYELHYDYTNNKYGNKSRPLFTETNCLMYEIKTEDVYKDFTNDKDMSDFNIYSTIYSNKSKYYDNSSKLVVDKMKDETAGVAIEEFFELKPKMYSYLVDGNREDKKTKGINKSIVAMIISPNEYQDVLLSKKCLRYSRNRIQSKDHRIRTYEISKFFFLAVMIKYTSRTMDAMD